MDNSTKIDLNKKLKHNQERKKNIPSHIGTKKAIAEINEALIEILNNL